MAATIQKTWTTPENYLAVIVKSSYDYLCGYIGIPEAHALYKDDLYDIVVNVHGGITYTNYHHLIPESTLWYIGFDCAHTGDTPEICDITYVTKQCNLLSRQLAQLT